MNLVVVTFLEMGLIGKTLNYFLVFFNHGISFLPLPPIVLNNHYIQDVLHSPVGIHSCQNLPPFNAFISGFLLF